jgi:hypothetical protein
VSEGVDLGLVYRHVINSYTGERFAVRPRNKKYVVALEPVESLVDEERM